MDSPDIQSLVKQLTLAREMAILGDYDMALHEFKQIFKSVHSYSNKYNAPPQKSTNSFAKNKSSSSDYYLQEKWIQFKKDLKSEYDMIV